MNMNPTTSSISKNLLTTTGKTGYLGQSWSGHLDQVETTLAGIKNLLLDLDQPLSAVLANGQVGLVKAAPMAVTSNGSASQYPLLALLPPASLETLGDPGFRETYCTRYAYYTGAMANAIASVKLVITLGKAGIMGSFGSAGLVAPRIEAAIQEVKAALPDGPYAFNLINSPNEPSMERNAADLFVRYQVRTVEASAYLDLTVPLVYYRAAGLEQAPDGSILIRNHLIAKLSRKEVAKRFMEPAPTDILNQLVAQGKITARQAELAQSVPMADDITVEADSGGHTDNRPLVCLLPSILALRDEIQAQRQYATPIRVGAGGGISTPGAAYGAYAMGAAYVVTGSVNQACVEAGASEHTRNLLAQAAMADVIMAPAADMFEMGVKVQVLKRGTMFGLRALKLYETYSRYNSIEEIPLPEREKLEKTVFKRSMDEIWSDTAKFFEERDPKQLERALADSHQKMALIFRWYLGLSSRWSNSGEPGREMDYQVWCGPAMGAFNAWTAGTYLAEPANRKVVDVALQLLTGAAYLSRVRMLNAFGVRSDPELDQYYPSTPLA